MDLETAPAPSSRSSNETRLLLLTIAVAVVVLLVLARFRFPRPAPANEVVPQPPLERVAASVAFDELASTVARAADRAAPAIVPLRILADSTSGDRATGPGVRGVAGVRVRDDVVLAYVPEGWGAAEVAGSGGERASMLARDPVTGLALVRVPARAAGVVAVFDWRADLAQPRYALSIEGSSSGPVVMPLFLWRATPVSDAGWDRPLLGLGQSPGPPPGAFVFGLDGQLVGVVVETSGGTAIVPGPMLMARVDDLIQGRIARGGDLGIAVQPLSGALALATGATSGVVVREVDPEGPSAKLLAPGDVVRAIGDTPILTPSDFTRRLARTPPGVGIRVAAIRHGTSIEPTIVPRPATTGPEVEATRAASLGLTLAPGTGGAIVRGVVEHSAGARAGLATGDVIVRIGDVDRPSPSDVERAYHETRPGGALVVAVNRAGESLVVALARSAAAPETIRSGAAAPQEDRPEGRS